MIISEDICAGVTCQNGGTCVNRTADFWWCECEKGWTGRNCEHNGKFLIVVSGKLFLIYYRQRSVGNDKLNQIHLA